MKFKPLAHCGLFLVVFQKKRITGNQKNYYIVLQVGNPQQILQKFPSVGKLLGQLFENTVILMSGS